jgi:hypothetical protein
MSYYLVLFETCALGSQGQLDRSSHRPYDSYIEI